DGNVADAARLAERNRTEFYRLLQKHGLTPGRFRGEPRADGPGTGVAEPDAVAGGTGPVAN
ncbi:MAG: two-component system response regulator GlrR, partial [Chitinophagaceae bacterium]|nr:two-component system response regulator GlrR [Rubrivivax sp.]